MSYEPKLKAGDIIEVFGWVMLQHVAAGRYRIDKITNRLGRACYLLTKPNGKKKICSHYCENIDIWLRCKGHPDNNRIEVVECMSPFA